MRLLLVALLAVTLYQCASSQKQKGYTNLKEGMVIYTYSGKTVKYMKVVGNDDLIIYFTDKTSMTIEAYKYPMKMIH